jgi:endonuclease/exonuclease/phosphatase (EEP) superfamily protein YafD
MDTTHLKIAIVVLSCLLMLISLLPLVRNDNWIFRVFEYPRSQKLLINIILLIPFVLIFDREKTGDWILLSGLAANAIYLLYQVWPYTFLGTKQIAKARQATPSRQLTIFICNVYQDNRDAHSCLRCIEKNNPDLILLVETDQWWYNQLKHALASSYPHEIACPLNNTYGMVLFSKLELIDSEIKFLVESDVPSIHTVVKLPSGELLKLYGLHPKPPVPQEAASSTERDAEILIVAKEAKKCKIPVIVAGDLNDVAWSYTTELFLKVSELLDPRRGRGFYNTFHAHYWFLRWPLDHVFCSKHFKLQQLQRLPSVGSDHFPIQARFVLATEEKKENEEHILKADRKEMETANEKVNSAL